VLTIRDGQLDAFRNLATHDFDCKMVAYLREEHPALALPLGQEGLFDLVRRARLAAAGYGVLNTGAVGVWIELWLMFGDELKRSPDRAWAERILRHPVLPDYVRVERVRERLLQRTGGRSIVVSGASAGS
jgi:hypothetical protein